MDSTGGLPMNYLSDEETPTFDEYASELQKQIPEMWTPGKYHLPAMRTCLWRAEHACWQIRDLHRVRTYSRAKGWMASVEGRVHEDGRWPQDCNDSRRIEHVASCRELLPWC